MNDFKAVIVANIDLEQEVMFTMEAFSQFLANQHFNSDVENKFHDI